MPATAPTTSQCRQIDSVHIIEEISAMQSADFAAMKREAYASGKALRIADLLKHGVEYGYYTLVMDKKTRTATISDSFKVMATAQGTLKLDGTRGPIIAESPMGPEWAAGFELMLDIRCATNRAIAARLAEAN